LACSFSRRAFGDGVAGSVVRRTLVNALDTFRKKRNAAGYDRAGLVSDADAKAMRDLAQRVKAAVAQWLKKHHPELLK
jgi:hypothetical protein